MQENIQNSFSTWRSKVKNTKLLILSNKLVSLSSKTINTKQLYTAFHSIKKQADLEALKAYINSLWKWKMSNF